MVFYEMSKYFFTQRPYLLLQKLKQNCPILVLTAMNKQ